MLFGHAANVMFSRAIGEHELEFTSEPPPADE
jgi:hypothetical protein